MNPFAGIVCPARSNVTEQDVTVTDRLQLTAPNIQLKDANRVFRIYIKSLGDKAVYRVEESVKLRSSIVDILHTIRSPSELQNEG
jgi:hypothetical protein